MCNLDFFHEIQLFLQQMIFSCFRNRSLIGPINDNSFHFWSFFFFSKLLINIIQRESPKTVKIILLAQKFTFVFFSTVFFTVIDLAILNIQHHSCLYDYKEIWQTISLLLQFMVRVLGVFIKLLYVLSEVFFMQKIMLDQTPNSLYFIIH